MIFDYFDYIPDDVIKIYIWPKISNRIKLILNKEFYTKYHNDYYNITNKYMKFIISNHINIALKTIINDNIEKLDKYIKFKYDNKIFYNNYSFLIYLSKKYNNNFIQNYKLKKNNNIDSINFSMLSIKEYKNYIDKNIIWTK